MFMYMGPWICHNEGFQEKDNNPWIFIIGDYFYHWKKWSPLPYMKVIP